MVEIRKFQARAEIAPRIAFNGYIAGFGNSFSSL